MRTLGENLSAEEIEEVINEADENGDGEINYREFAKMMLGRVDESTPREREESVEDGSRV